MSITVNASFAAAAPRAARVASVRSTAASVLVLRRSITS
jgi:hypothetical protein